MKYLTSLTSLSVGLALLSACSPATPSPDAAAPTLRQQIEAQSGGRIKLASFKKTDGQKFELNGIQGYRMDYEATLNIAEDGTWLAAGLGQQLSFEFSSAPPPTGALGGMLNDAVGGQTVHRGDVITIAGTMTGAKQESGWIFEPSTSQIVRIEHIDLKATESQSAAAVLLRKRSEAANSQN